MVIYNTEINVPKYFEFTQEEAYKDALLGTLFLIKCRSQVYEHSIRVGNLFIELSQLFNETKTLSKETIIGVILHDIGKISIDNELLNKKNKLDHYEFEKIKEHAHFGRKLTEHFLSMEETKILIESHHERWDGNGYPKGKKREEIPFTCRLLTVCDSIDAMTSERCYKKKLSYEECLSELINNAGSQFDPEMINVIVENFDLIRKCL